jgi:integrase
VIVTLFHTYGFRLQEVLGLERRQVDLQAGTIVLDPGSTKNDEARTIYLTPELKTLLGAQLARVTALEKKLGRICPALFPHLRRASSTKRPGQPTLGEPIKDIRRTWAKACRLAGVSGKLVHDFRRTAVRDMVRAGVTEKVAQTITGHKTRSVFERYNIVSPGDLQVAAQKIAAAQQ